MKHVIKIINIIDSPLAISREKGKILFDEIVPIIKEQNTVVLDFSDLKTISSAFLNSALGALYNVLPPDKLTEYVKINPNSIDNYQAETIKIVLNNARKKIWEHVDDTGELQ